MNDLELAISATLQAQAQGAAMKTDTPHEYEVLSGRLDHVDRRARNHRIAWSAVAAAAVVALVVVGMHAVTGQNRSAPVVAAPTPAMSTAPSTYKYFLNMPVPVKIALPHPYDVAPGGLVDYTSKDRFAAVQWCPASGGTAPDTCMNFTMQEPVAYVYASGHRVPVTTASDYVAHLHQLADAGVVVLSGQHSATVNGRPAEFLRVTAQREIIGDLACPRPDSGTSGDRPDCEVFGAGDPTDMAVLELPGGNVGLVYQADVVAPVQTWSDAFEPAVSTLRVIG